MGSATGGQKASGGYAGEPHPLLDEPKGESRRNWATLEAEGSVVSYLNATYQGEYAPSDRDAEYIRCAFDDDPENLGHSRLTVTVGTVGSDPVLEIMIRDAENANGEQSVTFDSIGSPGPLSFEIRIPSAGRPDLSYEYGASTGVASSCFYELDDFSNAAVSGIVACKNLVDVSGGTETLSASIDFECRLGDAPPDNPGSGGQSGSGGAPIGSGGRTSGGAPMATGGAVIASGGTPNTCEDGDTQNCTGPNGCSGTQTCGDGSFGACECPLPNLLLQKGVPWADSYQSDVEQTTGSELSTVASSMASQGYVVTAFVANTVPYTMLGVRPTGTTKTYQAKVIQEYGSTLRAGVAQLAQDGYLPTVGTLNSVFTIIGIRDPEQPVTYVTTMEQTTGSYLRSTVQDMGSQGYVPMIVMAGSSVPYTVIGVKPQDASDVYECQMAQTNGSGLDSTASSLTNEGYVITSLVDNTVPFTFVAARMKGVTTPLTSRVDQTVGSGLTSTTSTLSSDGWLVLAGTGQDAPYTFVGLKP
jgi:hypothetical protein